MSCKTAKAAGRPFEQGCSGNPVGRPRAVRLGIERILPPCRKRTASTRKCWWV